MKYSPIIYGLLSLSIIVNIFLFVRNTNEYKTTKEFLVEKIIFFLSEKSSVKIKGESIVKTDISTPYYYKKIKPLIDVGVELKKEVFVNNKYLVRTYYDQGFSILRMEYREKPVDMFERLDEFILDRILLLTIQSNSKNVDIKNPFPELSKRQKANIVANWYIDKWNVTFYGDSLHFNIFARAPLEPADACRINYRIIWGVPIKYKMFFSHGAPPEKLQNYIINNFYRVFVVNKKEKTIDLYVNGKFIEQNIVAIGHNVGDKELIRDLKTPEGIFIFKFKQLTDTHLYEKGYGPARFFVDDKWLWGTLTECDEGAIYFHGTRDETSIGKDVSEGCIRVSNDIIMKYYYEIPDNSGALIIIKSSSNHNNISIPYEQPDINKLFSSMGWLLIKSTNSYFDIQLEEKYIKE